MQGLGLESFIPHTSLIIYTLLSIATRLYRIGYRAGVVWDEVCHFAPSPPPNTNLIPSLKTNKQAHFGKFGAYYQNRTFFFDVHPPLGKMLVGLAGYLSGFDGSYDYPSGADYPPHVPFYSMRVLLAIPGILMVPLAWGTAVELRFTEWSKHLVTLMVLCGKFLYFLLLLNFLHPTFLRK